MSYKNNDEVMENLPGLDWDPFFPDGGAHDTLHATSPNMGTAAGDTDHEGSSSTSADSFQTGDQRSFGDRSLDGDIHVTASGTELQIDIDLSQLLREGQPLSRKGKIVSPLNCSNMDKAAPIGEFQFTSPGRKRATAKLCLEVSRLAYCAAWVESHEKKLEKSAEMLINIDDSLGIKRGAPKGPRVNGQEAVRNASDESFDAFLSISPSENDWDYLSFVDPHSSAPVLSSSEERLQKKTDSHRASYQYLISSVSDQQLQSNCDLETEPSYDSFHHASYENGELSSDMAMAGTSPEDDLHEGLQFTARTSEDELLGSVQMNKYHGQSRDVKEREEFPLNEAIDGPSNERGTQTKGDGKESETVDMFTNYANGISPIPDGYVLRMRDCIENGNQSLSEHFIDGKSPDWGSNLDVQKEETFETFSKQYETHYETKSDVGTSGYVARQKDILEFTFDDCVPAVIDDHREEFSSIQEEVSKTSSDKTDLHSKHVAARSRKWQRPIRTRLSYPGDIYEHNPLLDFVTDKEAIPDHLQECTKEQSAIIYHHGKKERVDGGPSEPTGRGCLTRCEISEEIVQDWGCVMPELQKDLSPVCQPPTLKEADSTRDTSPELMNPMQTSIKTELESNGQFLYHTAVAPEETGEEVSASNVTEDCVPDLTCVMPEKLKVLSPVYFPPMLKETNSTSDTNPDLMSPVQRSIKLELESNGHFLSDTTSAPEETGEKVPASNVSEDSVTDSSYVMPEKPNVFSSVYLPQTQKKADSTRDTSPDLMSPVQTSIKTELDSNGQFFSDTRTATVPEETGEEVSASNVSENTMPDLSSMMPENQSVLSPVYLPPTLKEANSIRDTSPDLMSPVQTSIKTELESNGDFLSDTPSVPKETGEEVSASNVSDDSVVDSSCVVPEKENVFSPVYVPRALKEVASTRDCLPDLMSPVQTSIEGELQQNADSLSVTTSVPVETGEEMFLSNVCQDSVPDLSCMMHELQTTLSPLSILPSLEKIKSNNNTTPDVMPVTSAKNELQPNDGSLPTVTNVPEETSVQLNLSNVHDDIIQDLSCATPTEKTFWSPHPAPKEMFNAINTSPDFMKLKHTPNEFQQDLARVVGHFLPTTSSAPEGTTHKMGVSDISEEDKKESVYASCEDQIIPKEIHLTHLLSESLMIEAGFIDSRRSPDLLSHRDGSFLTIPSTSAKEVLYDSHDQRSSSPLSKSEGEDGNGAINSSRMDTKEESHCQRPAVSPDLVPFIDGSTLTMPSTNTTGKQYVSDIQNETSSSSSFFLSQSEGDNHSENGGINSSRIDLQEEASCQRPYTNPDLVPYMDRSSLTMPPTYATGEPYVRDIQSDSQSLFPLSRSKGDDYSDTCGIHSSGIDPNEEAPCQRPATYLQYPKHFGDREGGSADRINTSPSPSSVAAFTEFSSPPVGLEIPGYTLNYSPKQHAESVLHSQEGTEGTYSDSGELSAPPGTERSLLGMQEGGINRIHPAMLRDQSLRGLLDVEPQENWERPDASIGILPETQSGTLKYDSNNPVQCPISSDSQWGGACFLETAETEEPEEKNEFSPGVYEDKQMGSPRTRSTEPFLSTTQVFSRVSPRSKSPTGLQCTYKSSILKCPVSEGDRRDHAKTVYLCGRSKQDGVGLEFPEANPYPHPTDLIPGDVRSDEATLTLGERPFMSSLLAQQTSDQHAMGVEVTAGVVPSWMTPGRPKRADTKQENVALDLTAVDPHKAVHRSQTGVTLFFQMGEDNVELSPDDSDGVHLTTPAEMPPSPGGRGRSSGLVAHLTSLFEKH